MTHVFQNNYSCAALDVDQSQHFNWMLELLLYGLNNPLSPKWKIPTGNSDCRPRTCCLTTEQSLSTSSTPTTPWPHQGGCKGLWGNTPVSGGFTLWKASGIWRPKPAVWKARFGKRIPRQLSFCIILHCVAGAYVVAVPDDAQ